MYIFKYTRLLLTLSLLLASTPVAAAPSHAPATAETWIGAYGGRSEDITRTLVATADGGTTIAGETLSFGAGGYDAWVVKLDSVGDVRWQKTYGGSSADSASSIIATADGGYVVAGNTESFGAGDDDAWVLRLDAAGNVLWQKVYGGRRYDITLSLVATADGGYAVAGYTESFGDSTDVWLLKLDAGGNVQWQRTYGGSSTDWAFSLVATTGGYAIAGRTYSFADPNGGDLWVLKLDPAGDMQWQKTYGGSSLDQADSLIATTDGGYAVAGWTRSFGPGDADVWVLKLDPAGEVQWQKTYGGQYDDWGHSLVATADGGYVVAGSTASFGNGADDVWVLKLDARGNVLWQKTNGDGDADAAFSLVATADGGYAVTGLTDRYPDYNAGVVKLDANGEVGEMCSLTGKSNATILDTAVTPQSSSGTSGNSAVTVANITALPRDSNATTELQCIGGSDTVHVASIDPRYQPARQGYRIGVEIEVVDALDHPVADAEVALTINLPNGRQVRLTGLTGPQGHFSPMGMTSLRGTYIFTVTGVRKAGYVYDPAQNVETTDSVTIP